MVQTPEATTPDAMLRFLADQYETAQRVRLACGERIRALLQGRDWTVVRPQAEEDEGEEGAPKKREPKDAETDATLARIRAGKETGPVPILGRTYARYFAEEVELQKEMAVALERHPVWPWLSRVRGVGPTLSCKLLARLDITKAEHASSFWMFCGLSTVPGEKFRCATCGREKSWAMGVEVTGKHLAAGSTRQCKGVLEKVAGPDDGVRVAMPRARKGEKMPYDAYGKKVLYLIGGSFLKVGRAKSPFAEMYYREKEKIARERPGWDAGRIHLTALRKVEKIFLANLWTVWRDAVGLPVSQPYAVAVLGHDPATLIDPWDMVSK